MRRKAIIPMIVLSILIGIVVLCGAIWLRVTAYDTQQPIVRTPDHIASSSSSKDVAAKEVTFTGTITAVKDLRPVDGSLSIEVGGNVVDLGGGDMPSVPAGSVIGLDLNHVQNNVGKRIEVFARVPNPRLPNYSTIVGDSKYYVKAMP